MSLDRRQELINIADNEDIILIEDDYDANIFDTESRLPTLYSLDRSSRVIYIGTLSKAVAPGLRLGFIVAPQSLIAELRSLRRLMMRHTSSFIQRAFAYFMCLGYHSTHLRRLGEEHEERASIVSSGLENLLPDHSIKYRNCGSSFWIECP